MYIPLDLEADEASPLTPGREVAVIAFIET